MALVTESPNRVWQRVAIALRGANEVAQQEFKALKMYLATQAKNPSLQFVSINGFTMSSDGTATANNILLAGAGTLYALYLRKAAGATAVWFKGSNNATTAATDGSQVITEQSAVASEDIVRLFNTGKALSAGLTVTQNTLALTGVLTLNANRFDGFVLLG